MLIRKILAAVTLVTLATSCNGLIPEGSDDKDAKKQDGSGSEEKAKDDGKPVSEGLALTGFALKKGDVKPDKELDFPVSRFVIQVLDEQDGPVVGAKLTIMRYAAKGDGKLKRKDSVTEENSGSNVFTLFISAGRDYSIGAESAQGSVQKQIVFSSSKPVDVSFPLTVLAAGSAEPATLPGSVDPADPGFEQRGLKFCDIGSGNLRGDMKDLAEVLVKYEVEGGKALAEALASGAEPYRCYSGKEFPLVHVLLKGAQGKFEITLKDVSKIGPDYYYGWDGLALPKPEPAPCKETDCFNPPPTPEPAFLGASLKFCDTARFSKARFEEYDRFLAILNDNMPEMYMKLKATHEKGFTVEECRSGKDFPTVYVKFGDGGEEKFDASALKDYYAAGSPDQPPPAPGLVSTSFKFFVEASKEGNFQLFQDAPALCGVIDYSTGKTCDAGKTAGGSVLCADGGKLPLTASCGDQDSKKQEALALCKDACSKPVLDLKWASGAEQIGELDGGHIYFGLVFDAEGKRIGDFGPIKAGQPVEQKF